MRRGEHAALEVKRLAEVERGAARVACGEAHHAEFANRERMERVIAADRGAVHSEDPVEHARRLIETARRIQQAGVLVEVFAEGGVPGADEHRVERDGLADEPLGPVVVPLAPRERRELAEALGDVGVEVAVEAAAHGERFVVVPFGVVVAPGIEVRLAEAIEQASGGIVVAVVERALHGEGFEERHFGGGPLAALLEQKRLRLERPGEVFVGPVVGRPLRRETESEEGVRRVEVAEVDVEIGEGGLGAGRRERVGVEPLVEGEATPEKPFGVVPKPERLVDAAERAEHLRLHFGLGRELVLDPVRAFGEELPRGDLGPPRLGRVGELEQPGEERRDLRRLSGFELGAVALGGEAEGVEPDDGGEHGHDPRRRRHADTVAHDELPQPVGGRRAAGFDGDAAPVAADVVGERFGGGVARLGFLRERFERDRVEVAGEPAGQALGRRAARVGDALRRDGAWPLVAFEGDGLPHGDAGAQRLGRQDRRFEITRMFPVERVRPSAGEEFVEERAEGIDVGGGRDGLAADLLGRGVLRRHRAEAGPREVGPVAFEQARDTEVEELHLGAALAVDDEDVRRLEVAVDDEAAVGIGDGVADPFEEGEARVDTERPRVAVRRDRFALNDLHREVRPPVLGEASVEEAGDAGVGEAS